MGGTMFSKIFLKVISAFALSAGLMACGGGGGGGGSGSGGYYGGGSGGGGSVLYYPYEDVYGDACSTMEASPGCTFDRTTGLRIDVTHDPHYDQYSGGSDDLWYVEFDAAGNAAVYNQYGSFQYFADVSDFAGYVGGSYIGVGTTGLFWEDIRNGTYWLGKNGVLYSANLLESNYGDAINDESSDQATDTNFSAINSDGNKKLVKMAAEKLVKEYGFQQDKARAVASALNVWAVAGIERGVTTTKDIDNTFKTVFGVNYGDAVAAVKDFAMGDKSGMQDITNRSASALGLKPHQAQKFMKGMYKKALAEFGYDVEAINW
jgi:hypothetical protein